MIQEIECGQPQDFTWEEELIEDGLAGDEREEDVEGGDQAPVAPRVRESKGQRKRRQIQDWIFDSGVAYLRDTD